LAVRNHAGLFDVSHMGEIEIRGAQALNLIQHVISNDASKLADGQAQYSGLMTPLGTFVDDLLVQRIAQDHYLLCVNASNQDKDFQWIVDHTRQFDAEVENVGSHYAQLALQGPNAVAILQPLVKVDLSAIKYYWFANSEINGVPVMIARTGYTGEDGFELYFDENESEKIWNLLLAAGKDHGLIPCGLAARNTLRLEAGMALYGNDIDDTTTVYEANLGWTVKLDKGDFIGRDALARQKVEGVNRKLIGFEMIERGIGRDHYPVVVDGKQVGQVSSGSPAPYLKKNIGLAYLPISFTQAESVFHIDVRGKMVEAQVVPTPFYKRSK
jgi:aminomethyltransferase